MQLEPCIIPIVFLDLSDSEPDYSYKLYSYKNVYLIYEKLLGAIHLSL